MLDKDAIKRQLDISQIEYLLEYYGGEPSLMKHGVLVALTIDHNPPHSGSRKLYYYDNEEGGLFRSYTAGGQAFDVFELLMKIYSIQFNQEIDLPTSIKILCNLLSIPLIGDEQDGFEGLLDVEDFTILKKYDKINSIEYKEKKLEFKIYENNILNNLPQPRILPWEEEGISSEVIRYAGIRYNPKSNAIVIPYYDDLNNLIGIRERTMIKENEDLYGKYRPAYINHQLYNHPLGLSLYNLNHAKDNIAVMKKAILVEGEKSVLKYATYFGIDNDICVATCGSSLSVQQVQLLMKYGAEELIIAFDRDYETLSDDVAKKQIRNLKNIHKKFSSLVNISFIWDKEDKLQPHMSPIDAGKDIFLELFKERVKL